MARNKKYDLKFKKQILEILNSGKDYKQVAVDFKLPKSTVRSWQVKGIAQRPTSRISVLWDGPPKRKEFKPAKHALGYIHKRQALIELYHQLQKTRAMVFDVLSVRE